MRIRELFGLSQTAGDVGIEIEMEGSNHFPTGDRLPRAWRAESDGSLRGSSIEYILKRPINIDSVGNSLAALRKSLADYNTRVNKSFRAGVHVHVNVQELTFQQVVNFAVLYYIFESTLVKYCGSQREGNHFCLRLKDAEYPLYLLETALDNEDYYLMRTQDIRYASLNFNSMYNFGSLEFRAMETMPDMSKIEDWAKILCKLRDYACSIPNLQDVANTVSMAGPEFLLQTIVGERLFEKLNHKHLNHEAVESLRLCQDLIYR